MAIILSIETSTQVCSVAVHQDGQLLAKQSIQEEGGHSKMLTLLIEACIKDSQLSYASLDAIAVSIGPGSYTGLRIGLASAKGLCYGLDIPLIGVDTLAILTEEAIQKNQQLPGYYCPMLDARRMEVYTCIYDGHSKQTIQSTGPVILEPTTFSEYANQVMYLFGNGASKWQETCQHPNSTFLKDPLHPSAAYMGDIALTKFLNKNFEDIVTAEPAYLKEFVGTQAKK